MKTRVLVVVMLVLALAMLACKGGDPGGGGSDATATYGAEQFQEWLEANETPEP